ncbi:MAG: hypothetical protein V1886_00040 [archaeon]
MGKMNLKEIVIKGVNSGSKAAFLGLTLALSVNAFNHLTEGKYHKPIPYKECQGAVAVLGISYILADITDKYKKKDKN